MHTRLSIFCDTVLEAGFLLALILVPLFFNISSNRAFESDKIALLRSIALVMIVVWIIKVIDGNGWRNVSDTKTPGEVLKQSRWQRLVRTPLVLPVMLFAGSYILSTLLSVAPRNSLLGSYLRLQGTYTTLSYVALFALVLNTIHRQEQVDRLCTAIVLTSLPISFYGILQHYHLDPIVWGSDVTIRVTSSLGNPIFLAAYLIMATPLTLVRIIRSFSALVKEQERKISHALLIICYTFILIMHLICIIFTQSRGPWLGLLGGIYIFILVALISLRNSTGNQSPLKVSEFLESITFTVLSIPVGILPAYVFLVFLKRGWRWLWLSWIFHTVLAAGFLILFNLPHTPFSSLYRLPYVGRLGELSQTGGGTGKVRVLIWEGTLNLLKADPLRTVIGYGPETMQLMYGPYYPVDLVHYEGRNILPDRSHNETFDVLVNTGVVGFIVYMFLFGSIFYYGIKWLGFMETERQRILFLLLVIAGALSGVFLPKLIEGTYRLSGVGLPVGFIAAACLYFMLSALLFPIRERQALGGEKQLLLIALFSAIVAHFIEIHFGIAIAATRVYFWIYTALFVVIGLNRFREETGAKTVPAESRLLSQQERSSKRAREAKRQGKQATLTAGGKAGQPHYSLTARLLAGSLLVAIILFILGIELCANPDGSVDVFSIIQRSLTTIGPTGNVKSSYGIPWMFFLTWLAGELVVFAEIGQTAPSRQKVNGWISPFALYAAVTLMVFFSGVVIQASLIKPDVDSAATVTFYYGAIAVLCLLMAFSLMFDIRLPERVWRKSTLWTYPVLIVFVCLVIVFTNVNVVKADVYYKQGLRVEKEQRWDETIQFFDKAISLNPFQDHFHTDLSRALIGKSNAIDNRQEKSRVFEEIFKTLTRAQRLNPLNPDHYANLGLLYLKWAEISSSQEERTQRLNLADVYYGKSAERDPYNTQIFNCWALVSIERNDYDGAHKKLTYSLSLDKRYGYTHFILGELYFREGKLSEAVDAYRQSISYDPNNALVWCSFGYAYLRQGNLQDARDAFLEAIRLDPRLANAHSNLGLVYFKLGQMQQAIEENLTVIQIRPDDLITHRNLALLYLQVKQNDKALFYAQEALRLSPEPEKPVMQNLVDQLKAQKKSDQS